MADRLGIRGRDISLYVRFLDPAGNPINADSLPSVQITDAGGVVRRASSTTGVSLEGDTDGTYRFDYEIPLAMGDGYAQDFWTAVIGGETVTADFQFLVQESGEIEADVVPVFSPTGDATFTFTKCEAEGIDVLMSIVKKRVKNDGTSKAPDPDDPSQTIDVSCSVFSDDELICFLINSLSEFNQWPHFTNFGFCDAQITGIFMDIIIQGAVLLAMAAQALIERGREFSITDNGVTYQPPQVSEILNSQYGTQLGYYKEKLKMIKTSLKPNPLSLGTFRVTAISPNYIRLRHLRERQIL